MEKNYDLTKILNRSHEGKWVALSPDRYKVLGSSDNLVELHEMVKNQKVTYMKVLPSDIEFAF